MPHLSQGLSRLDRQPMEKQIVSIVVRLEKLCRVFAGLLTHRHELKRHDVNPAGFDRCEVICKAKILTASLLERLARKCESQLLGLCVVLVNDQVVAARLAWEIAVHEFCFKQMVTDRLSLKPFKSRINFVLQNTLIFLRRSLALLELPLPLEQSGLVDERKNLRQVLDLDDLRSVKR